MKLFLSPHNDDETLFGAFTIQREKPLVIVVFSSFVQAARGNPVTSGQRHVETISALRELDPDGRSTELCSLGIPDSDAFDASTLAARMVELLPDIERGEQVWAPAFENGGHDQHNLVAKAADLLWPGKVTHYLTYTRTKGKSRSENEVPATGEMVRRKLRALACYESQIDIERLGCRPHFMRDLYEYYE